MSTGVLEPEIIDSERELAVPSVSGTALESLNRSEIDQQIATAKRWPRSIKKFLSEALTLATQDEQIAATMFYAVPRGGKRVEGPSVRLAEICAYAWGNLRYGARIVDIGDNFVTAQGFCFDLERNTACPIEIERRITDKKGLRYNDDMIQVTCAAAASIALRQAVFKIVPRAFVEKIYREARKVAIGDASTLVSKMASMIEYFGKMGVETEQVCTLCQKPSVEDLTLDDLATLKGVATAIKDGDTTVDQAFPRLEGSKRKPKSSKLNEPAPPAEGEGGLGERA